MSDRKDNDQIEDPVGEFDPSAIRGAAGAGDPPPTPQPLVGFMTPEGWKSLITQVDALVQEMEALPDDHLRGRIFELLDGIDALHREGLRRLVRLFKAGVMEKVIVDPVIHDLMALYDLVPEGVQPEPVSEPQSGSRIPVRMLPDDAPPQLSSTHPHWVPVLEELPELEKRGCQPCSVEGTRVLLCQVGEELLAVPSHCAVDGSSLDEAELRGNILICPAHPGCRYDLHDGNREDGPETLELIPVQRTSDGRLLLGIGIPWQVGRPPSR